MEQQAALRKAAEAAGVAAFIQSLPKQYDTVVGSAASNSRPGSDNDWPWRVRSSSILPVLVLDEPTAALDPVSERAVVDGYRAVMRGRTTLIISHRRDVAMSADHVVVLHEARVEQSGRPADLIRAARRIRSPLRGPTARGCTLTAATRGRRAARGVSSS